MHTVTDKVLHTVQQHSLLQPTDTVFVAISGGADSVALLYILLLLKETLALSDVRALHLHHGLRGENADRDERFLRQLCADWQIPLHVSHVDTAKEARKNGETLEEAGRRLRYDFFAHETERIPHAKIATAHTASDQAETVLFRLIRGSGMTGVGGIPVKRGNIVRPLLDCTGEEIRAFCAKEKLAYMIDETNAELCYSRNRIRHVVLPALSSINPQAVRSIVRFSGIIKEEDAYLHELALQLCRDARVEEHTYSVKTLLEASPVIQKRALMLAANSFASHPLEYHHVQMIVDILSACGSVNLPGRVRAMSDGEFLTFVRSASSRTLLRISGETVALTPNDSISFGGEIYQTFLLSQKEYRNFLKIHKNVFKFCVSYDMIGNDLCLRTRQAGDRFRPLHRACGKSLKKWFNEQHVPPDLRDKLPVLCDEHGVLAVLGYCLDERAAVTPQTQQILYIQKKDCDDHGNAR